MFGLTPLGTFHTAVSLVAVAAGVASLIRNGNITWRTQAGKTYIVATVVTCVTALGIFRHGGFGAPHALAILTLIVLGVAFTAGATTVFGRLSRYVETVGYSTTFLFHMIPGVTETATRLPIGAPIASGPDDPIVRGAIGVCFVLFLIGAALQVWRLRTAP
jgi:uncharacterized membrane protein